MVDYDRDLIIKKLYWEGKKPKQIEKETGVKTTVIAGVIKWARNKYADANTPYSMGKEAAKEWYEKKFGKPGEGEPKIPTVMQKEKKPKKAKARPKDTLTFEVSVQVGQWDDIIANSRNKELKRYYIDVHDQILPLMFYATVDNTNPEKDLRDKRLVEVDVVGINVSDADDKKNWELHEYPMKIIKLDDSVSLEIITGGAEGIKDAYDNTIERLVMLNGMPRSISNSVLGEYSDLLERLKADKKAATDKKVISEKIKYFEDAKKEAEKKRPGDEKYLVEKIKYVMMGADFNISDVDDFKEKDLKDIIKEMILPPEINDPIDLLDAVKNDKGKTVYDYPNFLIMYRLLADEFYAIIRFIDFYDDYLKKDGKDLDSVLRDKNVFLIQEELPDLIPCSHLQVKDKDKYGSYDDILKVYKEYCKTLNDILPIEHEMKAEDILFYHQLKNLQFYNSFLVFDKTKPLDFMGWIGEVMFLSPRDSYNEWGRFYQPFNFAGSDQKKFEKFEVKLEPGIRLILDYYDLIGDRKEGNWSVKITADKMIGTRKPF